MRLIAILGALCALSQAASAQTGECRSIADPAARLACYDKATQPATANAPAARPTPLARPQASTPDSTGYVDGISDEDAMVNAKLHGICRGC
jgi:hypothetical protein